MLQTPPPPSSQDVAAKALEGACAEGGKPEGIRSVAFHTLGCKTNQLESSTMANEFRLKGWQVVPFEAAASLYVINTCTVTEKSDQESRRVIRRARLANPQARIAVTGCYAQVAPDELAAQAGVNFVIGNNFKDQMVRIIEETPASEKPWVQVSEIDKSRIVEGASSAGIDRTRGSLKIQDGCDFKCTYCIIWEARGLSRSLPVADIRHQLEQMIIEEGFKEVMLTGINIGQYQDGEQDLADLLQVLVDIPHNFRLRLTSLDPVEVTDKLVDVVAGSNGKIAPHFHLSAQSAEDVVLKRMARRHHVEDFIRVCSTIAAKIPEASIGSDIIVGFPGETDERFEHTYAVLRDTPIHYFHVFSYSKRKGTPAAEFPDQVPAMVKKARTRRLIELSEQKHLVYRQRFLGQALTVIAEESLEKGMSENYIKVSMEANGQVLQPNDWVRVKIVSVTPEATLGEVEQIL